MHKQQHGLTVNVMAPLLVGNPANLDSSESHAAWQDFATQLREIKKLGAYAVSTDVWWGIIEPREGAFDWSYYDRLARMIRAAGLKWIPILSFHQCGGNIGDDVFVPLPAWVWIKLARLLNGHADAAKFVSEQGNASNEYVSIWATPLILDSYIAVMKAFQAHYAFMAADIVEINISLGPAGELRHPSYNSHDKGTDYPTRGALQAYSSLARAAFISSVARKYKTSAALDRAWGKPLDKKTGHVIEAPRDVEHFFRHEAHRTTQYGRDFFDWYSDSLIEHGRLVMTAAIEVFASKHAPFAGIDLAAKVPGIHWRVGRWNGGNVELTDRLAELSAGLIRTSQNDWNETDGMGYRPLLSLFQQLAKSTCQSRVVLHFTCLEMADGDGAPGVNSMAYSLVRWVGREAAKMGLPIKGENALGFTLGSAESWHRICSHLQVPGNDGAYEGVTFLRMGTILDSPVGRQEMLRLKNQLVQLKIA